MSGRNTVLHYTRTQHQQQQQQQQHLDMQGKVCLSGGLLAS